MIETTIPWNSSPACTATGFSVLITFVPDVVIMALNPGLTTSGQVPVASLKPAFGNGNYG